MTNPYFMGNLGGVDSLFTSIPLEGTIDIWANTRFKNMEKLSLWKIEFRNFYLLLQKHPFLIENSTTKSMESLWVHFKSIIG